MWAAAALPIGFLAWFVAPAIKDSFSGAGNLPMIKALVLLLTYLAMRLLLIFFTGR